MTFKTFCCFCHNVHYGLNRSYTFEKAAATCASLGGRLPEIYSSFENQYIRALIGVRGFWKAI